MGRFSPSESPQPHQQQLEHSSDPLPDPRNLKQSAEPTKRTRVEEQHSVQLAPTEFAFIDEPPRQPDPVQPAASEVGGAPKRVAARLPAFGEVWGRFAAFRWNSAPPTTASESVGVLFHHALRLPLSSAARFHSSLMSSPLRSGSFLLPHFLIVQKS